MIHPKRKLQTLNFLKSALKALLSKVQPLQAEFKEVVRAEPTNNRTAGTDKNHSTGSRCYQNSTLYVNNGGYSSNCRIVPAEFLRLMAKYTTIL